MWKRTLSGIIYVVLMLAGMLGGAWTFGLLFLCLDILCLWELVRLFRHNQGLRIDLVFTCLSSVFLYVSAFGWFSGLLHDARIFLIWPVLLFVMFLAEIYRTDKHGSTPGNLDALAYSLFCQLYITLPMLLTAKMAFRQEPSLMAYDYIPVMSLFILLWVSDTMAFLCGKAFGKHKLIERISPKKTWEGFFGGLIFSIIAALILSHAFPGELKRGLWLVYGLLVSLAGVFGDLFESLIKRTLNVKDSGNMIPGHGGILDRLDSSLFAIPVATLFLMLVC